MKGHPKPEAVRRLHRSKMRPYHHPEPTITGTAPNDNPSTIAPPPRLTKAERLYWDLYAPLLTSARILTPADAETMADYCRTCAAMDDRVDRLRRLLRTKDPDVHLVRTWDMSARQWLAHKTKLAGELGLTAVARTRVAWSGHGQIVDPAKKPSSRLAKLQAEAAALRRPIAVKKPHGDDAA